MKLNKAIEILNDLLGEGPQYSPDDRRDAVKLGIEALQRLQVGRNNPGTYWNDTLPGETPSKPLYALGFNTGDDESP